MPQNIQGESAIKIICGHNIKFVFLPVLATILLGCNTGTDSEQFLTLDLSTSDFEISSTSFSENRPRKRIPQLHTCYGKNASPSLNWVSAPEGTKSFALIVDEPENDAGPWTHWVLYNIPSNVSKLLPEIPTTTSVLPNGTKQGINDYKMRGYAGPCPPPLTMAQGGWDNHELQIPPSRYIFRIYALNSSLTLDVDATRSELEEAMSGYILATAHTAGKYTTKLGLSFKQGAGFMQTTSGGKSSTTTPVTK